MTGEPACPPLPRTMQLHRIEPHLHAKTFRMVRHSPLGWKQGKLSMSPARFVERFDLATPRFALAIIDLAQIQNRTLHHTTTCTASAFDNAPVAVFLAVLPSPRESQVHGPRFYAQAKSRKEARSASSPLEEIQLLQTKFQNRGASWESWASAPPPGNSSPLL